MKKIKSLAILIIFGTIFAFALSPFGWTFNQTLGISYILSVFLLFLVSIYEEICKKNKI